MAAEPTVLRLTEYERQSTNKVTLRQAGLLREGYGSYVTVDRSWEELDRFNLTAGHYIGTIVTDDLRIHIEPKTPITNLFFMLTYAYNLAKFRDAESPLAAGEDLFEFLLEIFVKQIDELVRQGIFRGYIDFEENQPYLRGRLMLAQQLRKNALQNTRFQQRTNELTADLPENWILKFTLWQLSRMGFDNPDLRRRLRRTLSAFSEVSLTTVGPADCDRIVYTRLNGAYQTPINLARLFLQHLSLEGREGDTNFKTYLLPMHQIFELFIARFLEQHFAAHPRFSVEIQPQLFLDTEQKEAGIPDIVIYKDGNPYLILDTKYKLFHGKPSNEDRNQMFMYCHTMGVKRAILIYSDPNLDYFTRDYEGMTLAARSLRLDGDLATFQERCRVFAEGFAKEIAAEESINYD
jgi:5-methylcytosine-specific restriction enzyme subunit McrC